MTPQPPVKATWTQGSAKLANTQLSVISAEALNMTLILFTFMRWLPVTGRVPWEKVGQAYVLYDPESMMEIQLNIEEVLPQQVIIPKSTFVLGLKVEKPAEAMMEIKDWCTCHQLDVNVETTENEKCIIRIPKLFNWAIMFQKSIGPKKDPLF